MDWPKSTDSNEPFFNADRPVSVSNEDKLGFSEAAKHVAEAINGFSSSAGFVFGLEGSWGSGKSSYVNLISNILKTFQPQPEIVRFSPWLVSSRDGMLRELFREIGQAASKIDLIKEESTSEQSISKTRPKRSQRTAQLRKLLASFAAGLTYAGDAVEVGAAAAGLPGGAIASKAIKVASKVSAEWMKLPTLEAEKNQLTNELRHLTRRIVVFVDDLDRLEPAEAVEVVRLVRAVADFPNIVYVLCYSRVILARNLSQALGIEEGEKYLQKIVQVTFSVPKPEDFDLRRMFQEQLQTLFPQTTTEEEDAEGILRARRLANVVDVAGGLALLTPRDVVRATNALQLYCRPMIERIDIPDMVWLQLIRVRNAELYDWIETYINNVASIARGAHLSQEAIARSLSDLKRVLVKSGLDVDEEITNFEPYLPGIHRDFDAKHKAVTWEIFHNVNESTLAPYSRERRLGSLDHFRFYFAFAKPSGVLDDVEFNRFLALAASQTEDAVVIFTQMAKSKRAQGGVVAEAVMSRIYSGGLIRIPRDSITGILICLSNAMDVAALTSGAGDWGQYWIWDKAISIFKATLPLFDSIERQKLVQRIFEKGRAIGWLTRIFRSEIFAHGRYGSRPVDDAERLLTDTELDVVTKTMTERYREAIPEELMKVPHLLQILYAWKQGISDGESQTRRWVSAQIGTDLGMISFLEKCRGWSNVNGDIRYPLKAADLKSFLNYDDMRVRVEALTQGGEKKIAARAVLIKEALRLGEDDEP